MNLQNILFICATAITTLGCSTYNQHQTSSYSHSLNNETAKINFENKVDKNLDKELIFDKEEPRKKSLCIKNKKYKIEELSIKQPNLLKTHKLIPQAKDSEPSYIRLIRTIDINEDSVDDMLVSPAIDGNGPAGTDRALYLNCGDNIFVNIWLDFSHSIKFSWNKKISPWIIITSSYILGPSMEYPDGGEFFEKYRINFQSAYYESFENNYENKEK